MSITVDRTHQNDRIDPLTDAGRLRWVLEFTRRDLDALTPEELEAIGDDLRHAAAPWWAHERPCTPMPAVQVRALQQEIHEGIQALLGDSIGVGDILMSSRGHKALQGGWVLPATATHLVRVRVDLQGRDVLVMRLGEEGANDRTAIREGVVRLIVEFGDRLCTCPVCGTPFLRQYRQAYCTVRCSNKVRNRRRLDRQTQQPKRRRNKKRLAARRSMRAPVVTTV